MFSLLLVLAIAIGLLSLMMLLFAFLSLKSQLKKGKRPYGQASHRRVRRVKSDLVNRLYSMMAGDYAAADRLLALERSCHPGRPERWYWEKVIQDLIRDRQ